MRCSSYCTASSYNLNLLVKELIEEGSEPQYFDDVIYSKKENLYANNAVDIFYFPFGCAVIWGAESESEELYILEKLRSVEILSLENKEYDFLYFSINEDNKKSFINEEKNELILKDKSPLLKLSMSHAFAQSVKLSLLERSVNSLLDKTSHIHKELAQKGRVSLSKKEISKQIGALFNERYSVNLHSDILDVPEFFWRRPNYEPLYIMAANFQDIKVRHDILNHRLDMIHELYNILSNELSHIHSTHLEMTIIVLIGIEIILGILNNNFINSLLC